MVYFKEGVKHFCRGGEGGIQLLKGRVQMLISIETYRTCNFPGGGPEPLSPLWIWHAFAFSNVEFVLLISEQLNFYTQLSEHEFIFITLEPDCCHI